MVKRAPASAAYLSVDELAEILRVNPMTIYRMIQRREIPALRVGKQYRIIRSEIERMFHVSRKAKR